MHAYQQLIDMTHACIHAHMDIPRGHIQSPCLHVRVHALLGTFSAVVIVLFIIVQEYCDYNDGPGVQHIALNTSDIISAVST